MAISDGAKSPGQPQLKRTIKHTSGALVYNYVSIQKLTLSIQSLLFVETVLAFHKRNALPFYVREIGPIGNVVIVGVFGWDCVVVQMELR